MHKQISLIELLHQYCTRFNSISLTKILPFEKEGKNYQPLSPHPVALPLLLHGMIDTFHVPVPQGELCKLKNLVCPVGLRNA